jgi:hypothetical protein
LPAFGAGQTYRAPAFFGLVFVPVGLAMLLLGIPATASAVHTYEALRVRGVVADATVVGVSAREHNQPSGQASKVIVLFTTANGPVREDLVVAGTPAARVEVGSHLQVTYDSADPSTVEIAGQEGWQDFAWSGVFLVGGLVFTTMGGDVLAGAYRRRRLMRPTRSTRRGPWRPRRWDGL